MPIGRCISGDSHKRSLSRTASVWNESSSDKLRSLFARQFFLPNDFKAWLLLLASWGNNEKIKPEKSLEFLGINDRLTMPCLKEPGIIIEEDDYYDSGDETKKNIGII